MIQNPPIKTVVKCEHGSSDDHGFITDRVVKCLKSQRIHKYYDSEEFEGCKHNFELIRRLELLKNPSEDVELARITDNRFNRLSYDYFTKTDETPLPKHLLPVLKTLAILHENNLVHSDVRLDNIIFTKEGARLIDFDLVAPEGLSYPFRYNHNLPVRHKDAMAGKQ